MQTSSVSHDANAATPQLTEKRRDDAIASAAGAAVVAIERLQAIDDSVRIAEPFLAAMGARSDEPPRNEGHLQVMAARRAIDALIQVAETSSDLRAITEAKQRIDAQLKKSPLCATLSSAVKALRGHLEARCAKLHLREQQRLKCELESYVHVAERRIAAMEFAAWEEPSRSSALQPSIARARETLYQRRQRALTLLAAMQSSNEALRQMAYEQAPPVRQSMEAAADAEQQAYERFVVSKSTTIARQDPNPAATFWRVPQRGDAS